MFVISKRLKLTTNPSRLWTTQWSRTVLALRGQYMKKSQALISSPLVVQKQKRRLHKTNIAKKEKRIECWVRNCLRSKLEAVHWQKWKGIFKDKETVIWIVRITHLNMQRGQRGAKLNRIWRRMWVELRARREVKNQKIRFKRLIWSFIRGRRLRTGDQNRASSTCKSAKPAVIPMDKRVGWVSQAIRVRATLVRPLSDPKSLPNWRNKANQFPSPKCKTAG